MAGEDVLSPCCGAGPLRVGLEEGLRTGTDLLGAPLGVRKSDIAFHLITKSLFFSLDGLSVSERGCGLGSRLTWTFRSAFLPPGPLACPGSCVFSPSSSRTHPHPHLCRLLVLSEWRSGAEQGHRFGGQTWAHVELSILLETARRGAECSFPNPCDREVEGWMAQEAWANS